MNLIYRLDQSPRVPVDFDGGVGYFTVYGQLPSVPAVTDYLIVCWFALKCI